MRTAVSFFQFGEVYLAAFFLRIALTKGSIPVHPVTHDDSIL